MNLKRRGFLGAIAALTASTPANVLKASGVSESLLGVDHLTRPSLVSASAGYSSYHVSEKIKQIALKTLAPLWFERRRRLDAHRVTYLEPHIACLVSVSPAAKINMQREFQYRTRFEREMEWTEIRIAEEQFKP